VHRINFSMRSMIPKIGFDAMVGCSSGYRGAWCSLCNGQAFIPQARIRNFHLLLGHLFAKRVLNGRCGQ